MSILASKIQKHFRKRGFRGVVAGSARFLLRLVYERKELVMFYKAAKGDFRTVPFPPSLQARTYAFFRGSAADVERIGYLDSHWKDSIRDYISEGAEIFLSEFDGQILMYTMGHARHVLDLRRGLRIPMQEHQVYLFDGQVAPEVRGKGIAQHHTNNFELEMIRRGFTEVISMAEVENKNAMRFHERNFTAQRSGSFVRLLRLKQWKWSDSRPIAKGKPVEVNS